MMAWYAKQHVNHAMNNIILAKGARQTGPSRQAGRQAGRQVSRQAGPGRQAGMPRQAGWQAGRQACVWEAVP